MHWEIRGLEKLSYRERQAVMLKESGHSSEDIAKILNVAPSSVATLLARSKAKGYQIVGIIHDNEFGIATSSTEDE
ncbi:MAG: hypothetical protein GX207_08925 [Peptococcaceae bacterium]|nr:hypothetical protein [Peptococcaceae bacterium]